MTGTVNTPDQAQIEKYQMCLKRGIKIKIKNFRRGQGGASVYSIQYSVYNFNSQLKYVYCIQFQLKSKRSLNGPYRIRFALAVKYLTQTRTFRACQVLDKTGLIAGVSDLRQIYEHFLLYTVYSSVAHEHFICQVGNLDVQHLKTELTFRIFYDRIVMRGERYG